MVSTVGRVAQQGQDAEKERRLEGDLTLDLATGKPLGSHGRQRLRGWVARAVTSCGSCLEGKIRKWPHECGRSEEIREPEKILVRIKRLKM